MRLKKHLAVTAGSLWGLAGLLMTGPAAAAPVIMGGVDAQSSYEGFTDAAPNAGVFTFFDAAVEATPAKGFMTTPPVGFPAFVGATIDLDIIFDVSVCNPAACAIQNAAFTGANAGADMLIWPSGGGPTPLLALEVVLLDVQTASPTNGGVIGIGTQVINASMFNKAKLLVVGGSEAAAITAAAGGSRAILRIDIDKPKPDIVFGDLTGSGDYWNDDFTVGLPSLTPVGGTNFDLVFVPEPGTAALLGLSLVGIGLHARMRRRR